MSAKFLKVVAVALLVCLPGIRAFGHGTPIDVSVDSSGRLKTDHEAYSGEFGGSLRTTTLPGFGVKLANSGLVNGDDLGIEVFGHVIDQYVAIDLLGLSLQSPLKQEVRFLGQAFEHYRIGIADLSFV